MLIYIIYSLTDFVHLHNLFQLDLNLFPHDKLKILTDQKKQMIIHVVVGR